MRPVQRIAPNLPTPSRDGRFSRLQHFKLHLAENSAGSHRVWTSLYFPSLLPTRLTTNIFLFYNCWWADRYRRIHSIIFNLHFLGNYSTGISRSYQIAILLIYVLYMYIVWSFYHWNSPKLIKLLRFCSVGRCLSLMQAVALAFSTSEYLEKQLEPVTGTTYGSGSLTVVQNAWNFSVPTDLTRRPIGFWHHSICSRLVPSSIHSLLIQCNG